MTRLYEKAKALKVQHLFLECLDNPNEGVRLWAENGFRDGTPGFSFKK